MTKQLFAQRYRVEGELGRGRGGQVVQATDVVNDTKVAIKLLFETPQTFADHEGASLVSLRHPYLVPVLRVGVDGEQAFVVQQLLECGSLAATSKPLTSANLHSVAEQLLEALGFLHAQGFLHGDIKTENVFVSRQAPFEVKLGDYGLARRSVDVGRGVTRGSPAFMPPEVIRGDVDDERSDLYSLGVALYECAFGELPFVCSTVRETLYRHLTAVPAGLGRPGKVHPRMLALLETLLAKEPSRRPSSAAEALARWRGATAATATRIPTRLGVLIGRDDELQRLENALERRGGTVALDGREGIGKSRLLHELCLHAALRGVAVSRSWDAAGLRRHGETQVVASHGDAGTEARARAAATAAAVRETLGASPFVLIVDHLDQAPEWLRHALEFYSREHQSDARPGQLLCVAGRGSARHFLDVAIGGSGLPEPGALTLQPWNAASQRAAACALLGTSRLDQAVVALLHETTGGVPAGVEFVCRALVAQGQLNADTDGVLTLAPDVDPSDFRGDWVLAWLEQLEAVERRLLESLALLEQPAGHAFLSRLHGPSSQQRLQKLERAGYIVCDSSADGMRYRLAHEGLRQGLLTGGPPIPPQRHMEIAAAFDAARLDVKQNERDWHLVHGTDLRQARLAFEGLAKRNARQSPERLRDACRVLLRLWPREQDAVARARLELQCIDACLQLGGLEEVEQIVSAALPHAPNVEVAQHLRNRRSEALRQRGNLQEAADLLRNIEGRRAALDAGVLRARVLAALGQHAAALEVCRRFQARFDQHDPLWLQCVAVQAGSLAELERLDEARQLLRQAMRAPAALTTNNGAHVAALFHELGKIEFSQARLSQAARCFQRAHGLFEKRGERFGTLRAIGALAVTQAQTGRFSRARASFRRGLDLSRRLGEAPVAANMLGSLGQMLAVRGAYYEALAYVDQGVELARLAELGSVERRIRIIRAGILGSLGLADACEAELERILAGSHTRRHVAVVQLIRSDLALKAGRAEPVAEWLQQARQVFEAAGVDDEVLRTQIIEARLHVVSSRADVAEQLLARVAQQAATLRLPELVVEAETLRADLQRGRHDTAAAKLAQRGLEVAHELGLRESEWRCERLLGCIAMQHGANSAALRHYEAAVRIFQEILVDLPEDVHRAYLDQPEQRSTLAELEEFAARA